MALLAVGCADGRRIPPPNATRSDAAIAKDGAPAIASDAETPRDAGAEVEGGVPPTDATPGLDGALSPDAEPSSDGAPNRDASPAPDAAPPPDAGMVPVCRHGCSTPADCALPSPIYDASHWACVRGGCEWLGCRNTADCQAGNPSQVCTRPSGALVDFCMDGCTVAADCVVTTTNPLYDEDNYACTGGACTWIGCHSDSECSSGIMDTRYRCFSYPGTSLRYCALSCTTRNDCNLGQVTSDPDNYLCNNGRCDYIGCLDDQECQQGLMNPAYVCR